MGAQSEAGGAVICQYFFCHRGHRQLHCVVKITARLGLLALLVGGMAACGDKAASDGTEGAASAQLYTCGMHPQVVQEGPGTCPLCGMDLTPMGGAKAASGSASGPAVPEGERKVLYWQSPMDPTYIRDEPGKSPMGMDLVPVYEDELRGEGKLVEISPGVIQQMGVETLPVERTTIFRHIRSIGEVEVGEDELAVVNLRFSGWIERIRVDKTGEEVKAGQVLFEIYSPELVAAQEEYLLGLRTQGADAPLTRSARKKLELFDLATRDIDAIAARGEASRTLSVRAPQSGFVLHKDVVEGARVSAGQDLYRIGNLKRIWVTAEVYEHDAPWVEVGQPAQLELTNQGLDAVEGKVSYIYPTLNKRSRTLTVRLEFDNPGVRLKPGMFATVHIQFRRKDEVIAVPTSAILNSGRRKLVFVAQGQGRFEPREITTGLQGDHRMTEVTAGLNEGELVVTSGQFLIDSESQLQEALQKILASKRGDSPAEDAHAGHAQTLWSCPMHPQVVQDGPGRCPDCGMFLEQVPEGDEAAEGAGAGMPSHEGHGAHQ